MIQAMYSGISGMKAFKTSLDVIGNNIANVNTTAYKNRRVTFKDMLSQTISGATAPSGERGGKNASQVGLGSIIGSIDVDDSQGSMTATGRITDLAIEGNGFFALGDGNKLAYTRDGAFTLDAQNNLVSASTGMRVLGWTADVSTGLLDTSASIGPSSGIRIPVGGLSIARPTTIAEVSGNLDAAFSHAEQTKSVVLNGNLLNSVVMGGIGSTVDVTRDIYDSEGVPHSMTVRFTKTANDNEWSYEIRIPDAQGGPVVGSGTLTFDANGNLTAPEVASLSFNLIEDTGAIQPIEFDVSLSDITQTSGSTTVQIRSMDGHAAGDIYPIQFDVYDSLGLTHVLRMELQKQSAPATWEYKIYMPDVDTTNPVAKGEITFDQLGYSQLSKIPISVMFSTPNGSQQPFEFTIDTSRISQLNGQNTVALTYQDGLQLGTLESFTIDRSGVIAGTFTNGASRVLGQIALAEFSNPAGLMRKGSNLLSESPNSGRPRIGLPNTGSLGLITSGFLEASNVDLAQEFANMIVAQRGFQANSRIISVSDDILQELVSLKR